MKKSKAPSDKFHWYLIAGNVVILTGKDTPEESVQGIPTNAMMHSEGRNLALAQIGRAQQALQVSLHQKMGTPFEVVDVTIVNIVHLGYMTRDEFNARPPGLQVVEKAQPSAEIVDYSAILAAVQGGEGNDIIS